MNPTEIADSLDACIRMLKVARQDALNGQTAEAKIIVLSIQRKLTELHNQMETPSGAKLAFPHISPITTQLVQLYPNGRWT